MKSIIALAILAAAFDPAIIGQQKFPVSVSIATPTPIAKSGAEIRVDVTVVNITNHIVRLLRMPGIEQPDGQAEAANFVGVYNAEGQRLPRINETQKWLSRRKVSVAPGQSLVNFLVLNRLFDLTKPGKYTVLVRHEYTVPDPSSSNLKRILVPSNTITINVTE